MRGQQLGRAMAARVTSAPTLDDWQEADVVVLVKHAGLQYLDAARAAKVPIVWDILDAWRQPTDNGQAPAVARTALLAQLAVIRPILAIGATEAQAADAGGRYLPHHSWYDLEPTPARTQLQVVAYEGNAAYLGDWLGRLSLACRARGWRFVVNPPDLREADLLVALRGGTWDGWPCRAWKSGVKLVNAIAAGRPVLTQDTAAAREIQPPGTMLLSETDAELDDALDFWADAPRRAEVVERSRALFHTYRLPVIADRYNALLTEALA